jgi:uncharacterized FlaG/YvyC family protein
MGFRMATDISALTPAAPTAPAAASPVTTQGPVVPVPPAAPAAPVAAATAQGQSLPPGGEVSPVTTTGESLGQAIDVINQFLRANAREFVFQLDASTGRPRVTVVNPQTGEIVRQIPEPHVVQLAQTIGESGMPLTGLLLNNRA